MNMNMLLIETETDIQPVNKLAFDWMANNPNRWRGKQVFSRRNGGVYTIREVMPRGMVELEKKGVLYTANIQSVRQDYEMVSP